MLSLKLIRGNELAEGVAAEMRLPQEFKRFSIGRDPGNQWPIPDRTRAISARHCEIVATPSGPALRDVSTNGTFVNGGAVRLAGDHLLRDGDQIQMGPFVIEIRDPRGPGTVPSPPPRAIDLPLPEAAPPAAAAAPRAAPARPLRGGDPAAMFASGAVPERIGLTQLLLNTPKGEAWSDDVTRIRAAPPRAAAAAPGPGPAKAAPVAPSPSAVNPPTEIISPELMAQWAAAAPPRSASSPPDLAADPPLLAHLAAGLGLPLQALTGHRPAELAHRVGALARAGVAALQQLLQQEARARRLVGGHSLTPPPAQEPENWRVAALTEAALQALLLDGDAAQASVQRAATELVARQARLLAAWVQLATSLDEDHAAATGKKDAS